jgi:hypothetical protein
VSFVQKNISRAANGSAAPRWGLLACLLLLGTAHIALTWGALDVFIFRDAGRWLQEVNRQAGGESVYRDFTWPYPPLSLWILGSIGSVFGTQVNVVWAATSTAYLLILVAFFRYAASVVPDWLLPVVLISGLLFSAAYANYQSAPLPLGMYTPAAPFGFLFLLSAAAFAVPMLASPSTWSAALVGISSGLTVLTKQDFWLPALYLVVVGSVVTIRSQRNAPRFSSWLLPICFGLTCAGGAAIIASSAGWNRLGVILAGYGSASYFSGRGIPSLERLTLDLNVLMALLAGYSLARQRSNSTSWRGPALLGVTAVSLLILYLVMTYGGPDASVGGSGPSAQLLTLRRSLVLWFRGALLHLLPVSLPFVVCGMLALGWQSVSDTPERRLLAFVLGFAVAARLRRGFEYVEWFHFLIELPAYALAIGLTLKRAPEWRRHAGPAAAAAVVLLAMYCYWDFGVGALTQRNAFVELPTPRGSVWVSSPVVKGYQALEDQLTARDPTRARPIFAFGFADAFSYFLERPSASPLTMGFWSSDFPPDEIVKSLLTRNPPPFVVDVGRFRGGAPVTSLTRWSQSREPTIYERVDRPYFDKLLEACLPAVATTRIGGEAITLYDCKAGWRPSPPLP